jgi:tRNA pseudouridine13 synthase
MKIKVRPEDFQVTERLSLPLSESGGTYSIYRLEKREWNTVDAISAAARANGVPLSSVGYGGKKDRHAATVQFLSVPSRFRLDFESRNVSVRHVGYADDFISPLHLLGNEFRLTVRDLSGSETLSLEKGIERVARWGFANYFDDQRFGSVSDGAFLAERLARGEVSGALQLFFCSIHPEDPAPLKALKSMRRQSWGDWGKLASLSRTKAEGEVARALSRGSSRQGMARAVGLIPREDLSMAFSAFQSFLWNETLKELVRLYGGDTFEVPGKVAFTLHFGNLEPEGKNPLADLSVPTEAGKLAPAEEPVRKIMDEVLRRRNLRRPQFNMRDVRKSFFKSFLRRAVCRPEGLSSPGFEPDGLYPGKSMTTLVFHLPKGSYATMLLKALAGRP